MLCSAVVSLLRIEYGQCVFSGTHSTSRGNIIQDED